MLDIKFIRENREAVEKASLAKGYKIDIAQLLELDEQRRQLIGQGDLLREQRNSIADQMKGGKPSPELIEKGKAVKDELADLDKKLVQVSEKFEDALSLVPNMFSEDTPVGGEEANETIEEWGDKKSGATDHLDFATKRDWVDFDRATKVAGAKFYYLKGDLALLEMALLQYAVNKVTKHGFMLMDVPYMVNNRTMTGTGFAPRTSDQSDEYSIEGEDLSLIATAEIPLTGYHADEIIDEANLPLLYAGYSPCFRKEAGAAGKYGRGLFRVHQFNKIEMYAYCTPEKSTEVHEKILSVEREIWQELGIPYRVIINASGDLGAPAYKKYDVEFWSPVDESYREISSCSNCTDFQARNLNIRVRRGDGNVEVLHTLNGTAISLARALMVLIENCQDGDKLVIPKILRPYLNNREVL